MSCNYQRTIKGVPVPVACGMCVDCLKKKSNDFYLRFLYQSHDSECFYFTVTYTNSNLPRNKYGTPICKKTDVQKWMKRFRITFQRRFGKLVGIKYFIVTEYSPEKHRPHYHGILFVDKSIYNLYNFEPYGLYKYLQVTMFTTWGKCARQSYDFRSCRDARKAVRYITKYLTYCSVMPEFLWRDYENVYNRIRDKYIQGGAKPPTQRSWSKKQEGQPFCVLSHCFGLRYFNDTLLRVYRSRLHKLLNHGNIQDFLADIEAYSKDYKVDFQSSYETYRLLRQFAIGKYKYSLSKYFFDKVKDDYCNVVKEKGRILADVRRDNIILQRVNQCIAAISNFIFQDEEKLKALPSYKKSHPQYDPTFTDAARSGDLNYIYRHPHYKQFLKDLKIR